MESCRICMGNTDVEVDLFTNQPLYHMEMTLLDMINEIVDLNIQCDKLPRKICTTCVSDAQVAFRFKRNCERSYNVFKALIRDEGSNDGGEANSDAPHNQTNFLDDKEWNPSSYDTDIIVKTEPSLELYVVNEMVNDAPDWENDFVEDNQRDLSLQDRNVIVKMEEDAVINISDDEDENSKAAVPKRGRGQGIEVSYKCTFCDLTFDHHMTLKKHLCHKSYIRSKVLRIHIQKIHLDEKFQLPKVLFTRPVATPTYQAP
ncbi:zinc finger protein kipf-like [Drosophila sulfurigaster albostrigata]|uniref:zinc finger protein kipf-like n=1 Tax=Drosophila sulfurigaster albostrigata TaxID=89887 RepID=UPI002D21C2FA|nr:zinc finger protein kipf-like [Drosophila sulfurigaster albostrigata]